MGRTMPLWGLAGLVLASSLVSADPPVGVDRAVERGVVCLKRLQRADGTWPYGEIGATALAGLALLECAVPSNDPAIQAAADAVRKASLDLTHTYSLALSILFLDKLGEPVDVALIESMTVRLLAGQNANGGWTYSCPQIPASEVRRLGTLIIQRNELVAARGLPKPGTPVKRTVRELPVEIQHQLKLINQQQGLNQGPRGGFDDNSNTQFATLALWVARRHGMPTEAAIARLDKRFRVSQNADGGWGYHFQSPGGRPDGRSTATMTCAGLLGLAVGYGVAVEAVVPDPKAKDAARPDPAKDPSVVGGLLALSTAVDNPVGPRGGRPVPTIDRQGRLYYFLWSLERVAVAYGLATIGNKDWYGWGAEVLIVNQNVDGSWTGAYADCGADTCFALLFLKRANLARDLTASLKGAVADPGEAVLKAGGIGGAALMAGKTKLDLSSDDEPGEPLRKAIEIKPPTRVEKPVTKEAAPDPARLGDELVRGPADKQTALLNQLRDSKGSAYTTALAQAIPKLKGPIKTTARDALADRLTRMTAATLEDKFQDENAEIRRAAALAVALKEDASFVPRLIGLLRDPDQAVSRAAEAALKTLTGQDLGPDPAAWKAWADRRGKP